MTYTEEECMNTLREADEKTEGLLTSSKYRELGLKPDVSTLHNKYGSWNKAKEKANLETITEEESWKENDNPTDHLQIPEDADFSREEWKNLSKPQRYYYRNKEKIKRRAGEHKHKHRKENREWIRNYKKDLECERCGETRHKCLQFHHKEKEAKDKSVSSLIHDGCSRKRIMNEVEKCEVLCANCHTIHHIENGYK